MQLTIALDAPPEVIETAPVQRAAAPVIRQRPPISDIVMLLIADGTLDFLDRKHLPAGVKETKVAKKRPAGRPLWLPRTKL